MISIEYLRQFRIGSFTIFDTTSAYLGVLVLSPVLRWLALRLDLKIPLISWLWLTLPISVVFHFVLRQNTPLMKMLLDPSGLDFYLAITVLLFMIYMGLKNINN